MHNDAPMRKFVHRPDGQPAAPVKELALLVSHVLPHSGLVIEHAAIQRNVLAARNDLQRIQLQVFHRAHRLLCALDAAPTPPGP